MVKLTVSFDMPDLERAISIAAAVSNQADWFCVGLTLIKGEGMRAIRAFSAGFPEREILADLRASIGAREEAMMAFESGADMISVAFLASERSCREAIGVAKTFGAKTIFDLYGATDPVGAARKGLELGFDFLYFRAEGGISGKYEEYRRVAAAAELPLIVDGEIEFREFARVSKLLPASIVVGRQVTGAEDPAAAVARFKELVRRRRAA
ncbi:MAG: orotidine 5'-phosphate decarboxylase [Actinobacteria bacterium]|nr:orotidine 5'-phosphate decarboxylase [Actinomycetota bacterium]